MKIGFTRNLDQRLSELRQWLSPGMESSPVTVLATFEGEQELEHALHHHFRHRCVHGREGFEADWVKATLPTLDLASVLEAHQSGQWDDEITEVLPLSYVRPQITEQALDVMLARDARWAEEVGRLRFPTGFQRFKRMFKRPLVDAEVTALVASSTMRNRAFVWCGLGGGLRGDEIAALRLCDLRGDGSVQLASRRVYLSWQAWVAINSHVATLEDQSRTAAMFPSRKGGDCLSANGALSLVSMLLAEQRIDADPGSLRTTHMVGLYQQGTALELIAQQLGYTGTAKMRARLADALL